MKRILALEQKIRDYVNSGNLYDRYFKSHPDEWSTLCAAMDALGDSGLGMEYYEASGIGDKDGEKYLKLYGLLQAVFLQQDSIRQLYRIFLGDDLQPASKLAWTRIRDLRNLAVGHPMDKKDKAGTKCCFISGIRTADDRFNLAVWYKDKCEYEFEDIDLKGLYELYKLDAVKYLERIYKAQVAKWGALTNE